MYDRISHAQNFEDVMLWRALSGVSDGRYIDIGAQSPDIDSVSRLFFEAGWRGVHVDANAEYAAQLRAARPGDVVIQAAITDREGAVRFHEIPDTGLSTTSEEIAQRHAAAGFAVRHVDVAAITLDSLFERVGEGDIHWLKIDVEGGERDALAGWRSSSARPWLVVVESTLPLSKVASHDSWEPMLLEKGYQFVWFDGLNRFYVSGTHLELRDAFQVPPNIFDDFAFSGTASAPFCRIVNAQREAALRDSAQATEARDTAIEELGEARVAFETAAREAAQRLSDTLQRLDATTQRLGETMRRLEEAERRLDDADARLHAARDRERTLSTQLQVRAGELLRLREDLQVTEGRLDHARHEAHRWWMEAESLRNDYAAILRSHSWRLTAPLRITRRLATNPRAASRMYARRAVSAAMRRLLGSRLRGAADALLAGMPAIRARLRSIAVADGLIAGRPAESRSLQTPHVLRRVTPLPVRADLCPAARRSHGRLRTLLEEKH